MTRGLRGCCDGNASVSIGRVLASEEEEGSGVLFFGDLHYGIKVGTCRFEIHCRQALKALFHRQGMSTTFFRS